MDVSLTEPEHGPTPRLGRAAGAKLALIAKQFCTPTVIPKEYPSYGSPPRYDPKLEQITKIEKRRGKIIVFTEFDEEAILDTPVQYVLADIDGEWRIEQKKAKFEKNYTKVPLFWG